MRQAEDIYEQKHQCPAGPAISEQNQHKLAKLIQPDQGVAFMQKCDECYYQ